MFKFAASAWLIACMSWPSSASTPVFFPPGQQLKTSSTVVMAVPRSISCKVARTSDGDPLYRTRAKVTWQVLVGWKGEMRVGDLFISDESSVATEPSCFYVRGKPMLLYMSGAKPFKKIWAYELSDSVERLKELDTYRKGMAPNNSFKPKPLRGSA